MKTLVLALFLVVNFFAFNADAGKVVFVKVYCKGADYCNGTHIDTVIVEASRTNFNLSSLAGMLISDTGRLEEADLTIYSDGTIDGYARANVLPFEQSYVYSSSRRLTSIARHYYNNFPSEYTNERQQTVKLCSGCAIP